MFNILQDGFNDKVSEMSNLRWLRLKRTQMKSLPEEIDRFSKLVSDSFLWAIRSSIIGLVSCRKS